MNLNPVRLILSDPLLRTAYAAIFLVGAGGASIAPYYSLIAIAYFGLTDQAFSLMLVASSAMNITASVTIGIIADQRANRRQMAILAALVMVVGALAVWLLRTPVVFVLFSVLLFPVAATIYGQIFAMARLAASTRAKPERDAIMAVTRAFFALPFILILPVWALIYDSGAPLISAYLALIGTSALIVAMLLAWWPRDGNTPWADKPSGLSFRAALSELMRGAVLFRVALVGIIAGATNTYMILLGLLFHQVPGRDTGDVALFAGIIAGLEVPAMLATGLLLARFTKSQVIAGGALFYAAFLFAFPFIAGHPLVWLSTIPAAAGAGVILATPIAYMQDLVPDRPGLGGTLLSMGQVASQLFAAAVFAAGTAIAGYTLVATLAAAITALAAVTLVVIDRDRAI